MVDYSPIGSRERCGRSEFRRWRGGREERTMEHYRLSPSGAAGPLYKFLYVLSITERRACILLALACTLPYIHAHHPHDRDARKVSKVQTYVSSFVHSFIRSFVLPFVRPFQCPYVRRFVRPSVRSFVRSVVLAL